MMLNDVIRTRRRPLGLTQEGLAERLGVSAPAVNKWEKAIHYPDITLLPALARVLGVDLNTLLSFQEDITEREIGLFLNQVYETAGAEGVAAAFALARDKLREFPNSDLLAFHAAGMLMGVLELQPENDSPERRHRRRRSPLFMSGVSAAPTVRSGSWPLLPWPAGASRLGSWTVQRSCWHSCPTPTGASGS